MKDVKRNQVELSEMNTTSTEMQMTLGGINSRTDNTE